MSTREGLIRDFLEKQIPTNWDQMQLQSRKMFLSGSLKVEGDLVDRDKVCALEIWVECFGGDPKYMKRMDSTEINNIMLNMPGWVRNKAARRYGPHGAQRGFERV